jgi:hypothetical protein
MEQFIPPSKREQPDTQEINLDTGLTRESLEDRRNEITQNISDRGFPLEGEENELKRLNERLLKLNQEKA